MRNLNYYTFDKSGKTVTVVNYTTASNDESRDAFYRCISDKTITGALNETVELYRPFAQLNFGVEKEDITAAKAAGIDVAKSKVTLTNLANVLNLKDGTVSGTVSAEFTLASCPTVMTAPTSLTGELLKVNNKEYGYVAMNYILVGKNDKTLTDATLWVADSSDKLIKEDGLAVTNVPLQGNYRTNILGNLFTSQVINDIVVVPEFETPDINKKFVTITADKIETANALIETNKEAEIIEVKFAAEPEDVTAKAILTTPVKTDGTLNVEIAANTGTLYVGDYTSEEVSTTMSTTDANAATVNITIPAGVKIENLILNSPTKTVNINGVAAAAYTGTQIGTLTATTSSHTLVIAKGQTVDKLIFNQGGLEIHGTVKEVEIPEGHGTIIVRACENLGNDVYEVLKPYIATGYVSVQNADESWNIAAPIEMNGVKYATLQDAVKAAGTEETTINILYDIKASSQVTIDGKKIILNTNGCTVTCAGTENHRTITVVDNGELTVIGGGKFIRNEGFTGDNSGILNIYSGKLTVGNVYLENANNAISVSGGAAVINDATMKALEGGCCVACHGGEVDVNGLSFSCAGDDPDGPGACWADDGGIIRIWGGEFEAAPLSNKTHELETEQANYCLFDYREYDGVYNSNWGGYMYKGYIFVYGGKFKAFNPANNFADNSYVAEGYQSVQDGDYWVVSKIAE